MSFMDLLGLALLGFMALGCYCVCLHTLVQLRDVKRGQYVAIGGPYSTTAEVLSALRSGADLGKLVSLSYGECAVEYDIDVLVRLGLAVRSDLGDGVPRWWQTPEGAEVDRELEEWRQKWDAEAERLRKAADEKAQVASGLRQRDWYAGEAKG